jgi:GH25 family lysozyme M1 (1,4-beta-N-acetylmuramidase)
VRKALLAAMVAVVAGAGAVVVTATAHADSGRPPGLDVSAYQGNVNWDAVRAGGGTFAYVKATEGAGYVNAYFAQQYNGSYRAGLIRGAYHFALPDRTSGGVQADYFVDHGGGWSADGKTLPGALDIEYNPYGTTCYGRSAAQLVAWIADFVSRYRGRTGRDAVIYTTTDWWRVCTGNSAAFSANPLWLACYCGASAGALPASWSFYTFWQFASSGRFPGDQNVFNGAQDRLVALAKGDGRAAETWINPATNKRFDLDHANPADGTKIQLWSGNGTDAQWWFRTTAGDGWFRLTNRATGKCVDVVGPSRGNGAAVHEWTCYPTDSQLWRWEPKGRTVAGWPVFQIRNKLSGRCLDIFDNGTADGTRIIQWDCHGGPNQEWY